MIDTSKILVTGGKGGLGRALATLSCNALGRDELDVSSESSVCNAIENHAPGLVINCAAYTAVDQAESDEAAAYAVNETGARHIANACLERRLPLIHISTDCVFGDRPPNQPVLETDTPDPLSVYGASKLAGEKAVLETARRQVCIVRASWLFDAKTTSFISKIMDAARTRETLQMVNDEYGRPTPLPDLAGQLIALADRMLNAMPVPEILHLGPREAVTRLDWAKAVFARSAKMGGPDPDLIACSADAFQTAARRPRGLVLDIATATALLGIMPSWREATDAAVDHLLADR